MGGHGSQQPSGCIGLVHPIRVEGGGGLGEKVLNIDADLSAVQRHRTARGD